MRKSSGFLAITTKSDGKKSRTSTTQKKKKKNSRGFQWDQEICVMGSLRRDLPSSSGSKDQGDDGRSSSGLDSLDCSFVGDARDSGATGGSEVLLNVYDLTPMNNYGYWFGVGVFHSGIEGM